ncbi:FAD-binding oxidoreductase [Deinococcus aerophilus]|uniref:Oxidoreductase n=1 Tax=Deinococcus aerophilus TaxID=522488 RepID=A0ABQ2GVM7_9DEIO|nr:FAD-binding oxidoreductase [Deinococcus aerophilus]GGM13904.1 oxidoreductase [Deinococcus aerophilus]
MITMPNRPALSNLPVQDAVNTLRTSLRGEVIQPEDDRYDDLRALYNGMIDKHPALIVRCTDVADVQAALAFATEHGLRLAIRGGGHNGGGLGSVDGGLVIDLSAMHSVRVDPGARTVRVEGGATWGQVDHATHAFGLAVPSGIISTTGVGGLTLGGGLGHLTRKYGLTIDSLLEADVVLADGQLVTASEQEHSDLFWAIRGGGGNFGIVTSFLFRAHPVDTIVGGPTLWTLEQAPQVMRWYREFIVNAPEDLNGFFAFLTVPPAPPFPEHLHLQKMCGVVWCYTGPQDRAEEVFAPIREFGPPALHGVHDMPYPALQSAFDGLYPPGHQWYWRADFVKELTDEAIAAHVEHARTLPTMHSTMHLYPVNGAAHRVGQQDTAWSYRDATWGEVIVGVDPDPANAGTIRDWCVNYWEAVHPYSMGGAYVNMMMDEGQDRVRAAYRDNHDRLRQVKGRYDPRNVFSVNQNIRAD